MNASGKILKYMDSDCRAYLVHMD